MSTKQLVRMFKVTPRQMQWWDEERVLGSVKQERHRRIWSEQNAFVVGVVAELRRKGMSLQVIRKFAREIERRAQPSIMQGMYLVAVRSRVRIVMGEDVMQTAVAAPGAVIVVDLEAIASVVRKAAA